MRDALIVSTARTPIGRAYRGAFNNLPSPTLAGHAIKAAVERAGIDSAEVDDVVFGSALQQGHQAGNIARTALLRAGLPVTVAGMSLDRQCASGLMAIATAAKQIIVDGMQKKLPSLGTAADYEAIVKHMANAKEKSEFEMFWRPGSMMKSLFQAAMRAALPVTSRR